MPIPGLFLLGTLVLQQVAFAPLTLLSLFTTTPPSAIHNNRLSPSRGVVARLPGGHRYGLPLLHDRSIVMRAVTTTPVGMTGAFLTLFPVIVGLPRYYGVSAPTTAFRGLLSVHSRYGPHNLLTSLRSRFRESFSPFVTSWTAPCTSGRSES
ncbi:hypothetical protein ECC18A13_p11640 (plasmid) [Enterobacter sp. 18A13]|nr:hypothetical protein ECC18A13_p11640 [Enterobacter sp. 18A13]